jgi:hypothetical protein
MSLGKSFATCLVLISVLLGWQAVTARAQGPCVGGMCRHGIARHRCLEVGCAPRSAFYNYYPTTWRRWPTDNTAAAPTPAVAPPAEQTPSTPPATQDSAPQVEPEQPGQPQITEDDATVPSDTAPGTTAPDTAPPLPGDEEMLPFEDSPATPGAAPSPAAPPSQEAPPSQDAPPALPPDSITDPGLPGLPPSTTPSIPEEPPGGATDPLQDAPPTMPDDPFKDDPVQPQGTPAGPTGMNDTEGPALSSNGTPQAKAWRATAAAEPGELPVPAVAKSLVPEESRVAPSLLASYPSTDEAVTDRAVATETTQQSVTQASGPRLLPPVESRSEELPRAATPQGGAPARRNPLRMASAVAEARPVVPVVALTTEDVKPAGTLGNVRRNPLRNQ